VTTGLESPERVEITSGLQAGEAVVVGSHDALYAGARVTPVGGPSPLPGPSGASPPGEMKGMEGTTGPGAAPAKPKEGGHGAGH
jgi:multidrug efflux system membrane fusion protein